MTSVGVQDLTEGARLATELARRIGQPPVVADALALAAHGYARQTSDVDVAVPVVIGAPDGEALERAALDIGFEVKAKHGFGGLDLRAGPVRVDVLTLDRDVPTLVPAAVAEAVASDRTADIFGQRMYVISLGHLIALKLIAARKKDLADIVELIKARIEMGAWQSDRSVVATEIRDHLGLYAVRMVDDMAATARSELGLA